MQNADNNFVARCSHVLYIELLLLDIYRKFFLLFKFREGEKGGFQHKK